MNNTSLHSADLKTHVKILAVSLFAAAVVVGVGVASRPGGPDMGTRLEARAPVLKPGPVIWSAAETSAIR
jgi:hypothetical protein